MITDKTLSTANCQLSTVFFGADGQILTAGKSGKVPAGQISGSGNVAEPFRYFYHPDHLGSTSYVTDASGEVYQHLEYFAFGETFVEEHSNTDKTPYLFNGKELDEETGLYYYGARYYSGRESIWLSVDHLAEKYAGWSPYNYTLNNPINYVDPDGNAVEGVTKADAEKFHEDIKKVFASEKFEKFRSLITRSGKKRDGTKFNKIDADALSSSLEGLEGDDLALAQMVAGAINSTDVYKVEYAKLGDNLSSGATEGMNATMSKLFTENNLPVPTMPTTRKADEVKSAGGSGQNFPTSNGSHSVILEGAGVTYSGGKRELVSFHEVFGHGIPTAKKTSHAINNTHAIQTENLVRRVMGISEQRDGSDHSGRKISNPGGLPKLN